jgi:uncharacterized protein (DUF1501 family)
MCFNSHRLSAFSLFKSFLKKSRKPRAESRQPIMNRRDFLTASSSLLLPLTMNGMGITALTENSGLVQALRQTAALNTDRILVMINLLGGNDGLNTVIPLDQYGAYTSLRSNIAIPQSSVLSLTGLPETGLHPSMTGMRNMFNDGKLSIIHSVGYPNPNQSHFRSADIWMSGVDSNQYAPTGWMGRYLQNRYTTYPTGYPNPTMEDPIALQIGYLATPTLQGPNQTMAVTIDSPDNFYNLMGGATTAPPNDIPPNTIGNQITFLRQQQALAIGYAAEIKNAGTLGTNLATYPAASAGNELADQLKIVARLIHGGLKTKIFFVSQQGYDTHSTQVDSSDTRTGNHATLLKKLSDAISIFQQDLELLGQADKVVGMTFSEFGRRATSNSSRGTDHGVAAPMFVFGTNIKKRIVGMNPNLTTELLPANPQSWETWRDIKTQIDFRRVYNDILFDWFGTSRATTDTLLFRNFNTVSLFSNFVETVATGNWQNRDVWSVGRKPLSTEYVKINAGHTLTVGQDVTVKNIQLQGNINFTGNFKVNVLG